MLLYRRMCNEYSTIKNRKYVQLNVCVCENEQQLKEEKKVNKQLHHLYVLCVHFKAMNTKPVRNQPLGCLILTKKKKKTEISINTYTNERGKKNTSE